MPAHSVLFICTANRCRSPMAEALLTQQVADLQQSASWQIQSAGTWAEADLPATAQAQLVMAQRGIELGAHRSRSLTADLLHQAAVILVMTHHQQEALQAEFPEVVPKTHLLSQLVGEDYDIEDPYGASLEEYQLCAADIERILRVGFEQLVQWAASQNEAPPNVPKQKDTA